MNDKKWAALLIGVLLVLFVGAPNVLGADNDDFSVTISGAYLECNIVNATWAIGTVQMSTSYWTNETLETQTADTHNSTAGTNIDFEMTISSDPADWKHCWPPNATTGPDQYKINASNDTWVAEVGLNLTVYDDVQADFDPADNCTFDLRFDSPTATTTGAQQTITLNGKVTVH